MPLLVSPRRLRSAIRFLHGACLLAGLISAAPLRADLIAWDDFEGYVAGQALNDQAAGHGWSNEWSAESAANATLSSDPAETLTYTLGGTAGVPQGGGRALKLAGAAENALLRYVPPQVDGRDIFVSFLFQIRGGTPGAAVAGNIFSGWQAHDGSASVANDSIGVVGLSGTVGARVKGNTTPFDRPLLYGRTYFFVIKYTGWSGDTYRTVQVWLDPSTTDESSGDPAITRQRTVDESGAGSNGFIGLRVRTVGLSSAAYQLIDDVRIGTAWDDVVSAMPGSPPPVVRPALIVFGDSLSSGGRTGTPSTGPLPTPANGGYPRETWIQQLAPRGGFGVLLNSYTPGGTNYAIGGDTTVGLVQQVDRYLAATGNVAAPDARYILWCGPNDISRAINPNEIWNAYSAAETAARSARERMEAQIRRLAAAGATSFVWPNLPDLSQTPAINAYGSLGAAIAGPILRNATNTFNNGMSAAINRLTTEFPGIAIHVMDAAGWFADIIADKTAYGFTDVTGQSKTDNGFLFYDNVHPTAHGHAALAARALQLFASRGLLPSPLENWRARHFGSALSSGNAADRADPDGDGVPNLLEYALGGHPLQAGSAPHPSAHANNGRLTLAFTRIADPSLTYLVQSTATLETSDSWTDLWTSTGAHNQDGPIVVTDQAALTDRPSRFLRLVIRR